MRLNFRTLVITIFCSSTLLVKAQNNNAITTASPFLAIPTDARASGMGDVGVATNADGNALFHNGAKMVFHPNEITIGFNYTPWLRNLTDDIYIGNVTYQQRIDERSAFGAGIKYFNYGEVEVTDNDGNNAGQGTPFELAIDMGYALKLSDNYSMAVALRYIRTDLSIAGTNLIELEPTNGFAVDVSGFYKSNEMAFSSFNGIIRGGFNINNIGPKVKQNDSENFLPTTLKFGGGFDFIFDDYNQVGVTTEFARLLVPEGNSDDDFISGIFESFSNSGGFQNFTIGLGAEYLYANSFAVRAGLFKENEEKGNRNFFTVGAGFKLNSINFDISYLSSSSTVVNPLENTLRFSVSFDIGDLYSE